MKINKKGSVSIIMIAVYISLIITSFYVILMKHSIFLEKKNNTDFAIKNASSISTNMITTDFHTWKTMFNIILAENKENTDVNYIYMIKKIDNDFNIYDLNSNKLVQLDTSLNAEQMLNIMNAYVQNTSSMNKIQSFSTSKYNATCLVINKNITQKINKDYLIISSNKAK